jgi:hypothetical protein
MNWLRCGDDGVDVQVDLKVWGFGLRRWWRINTATQHTQTDKGLGNLPVSMTKRGQS